MGRARNLARLIVDSSGDVDTTALSNVPPSNDASALTTGTLPIARIADGAITTAKLGSGAVTADKIAAGAIPPSNDASALTVGTLPIARIGAGAITADKLASTARGRVLQVAQTVKSDTFSTNSGNSYVEISGYSVTLTPSSSANKVLVDVCLHIGESSDSFPIFRMYRNGTELQIASAISPGQSGMFGKTTTQASGRDQYLLEPVNFKFLDSPNTTSPVTYTIRVRPFGIATRTIFVNRSQTIGDANQYTTISTITAMEIAG